MKLVYQQDGGPTPASPIYLLCVFRDEHLLLEYFVEYYRSLGVTHFIMIDNLSGDEGPGYLKSVKNINLWLYRTEDSYRDADYGTRWVNKLLEKHCHDQYCFTVDVDELFVFDSSRYESLRSLVDDMEASGSNVVPVTLLDMYPEETNDSYRKGSDFLSHSPFFDDFNATYYEEWGSIYGKYSHKVGGVRKRVLETTVCIHKLPFFKYDFYPLGVAPGYHFFQAEGKVLRQSEKISLHQHPSVLLHFKFIKPDFKGFVEQRIRNNEDWDNSNEYKAYLEKIGQSKTLQFHNDTYTSKLAGNKDLKNFF